MRDQRHARPLEERFFEKVKKSAGCWEWTGSQKGNYGRIIVGSRIDGTRRVERATRVAWFIYTGKWPENDVLQTCDNPGCVRFEHLYDGAATQNMNDMYSRKRRKPKGAPGGAEHPMAKLSSVGRVFSLRSDGLSQRAVGEIVGLSQTQVGRILRRESWKKAGPTC